MNTCKNYSNDGETLVIGGTLKLDGGQFEGVMNAQADSTATDVATLKADFNELLTKLKACGLMDADAE